MATPRPGLLLLTHLPLLPFPPVCRGGTVPSSECHLSTIWKSCRSSAVVQYAIPHSSSHYPPCTCVYDVYVCVGSELEQLFTDAPTYKISREVLSQQLTVVSVLAQACLLPSKGTHTNSTHTHAHTHTHTHTHTCTYTHHTHHTHTHTCTYTHHTHTSSRLACNVSPWPTPD